MNLEINTAIFGIIGVILGGLVSWLIQKDRASTDLKIALEAGKTEHMAERAVRHFLSHKGYTDRSFKLLQQRIGGFEDNDLRKLLVRAGAVRYIRQDGSEWWRLIERQGEVIERKNKEDLGPGNEDLL